MTAPAQSPAMRAYVALQELREGEDGELAGTIDNADEERVLEVMDWLYLMLTPAERGELDGVE